jgi:hypothetical protein
MSALPWRNLKTAESDKEYLALLSFLPLRHYRMIPKFIWLTFQTQRQLHKSDGLIGYSLDAQPLSRKFWTLSVWQDFKSLMDFVRQLPHGKIMHALAPHMGKTQFVQWKVTSKDIPPRWQEAKMRMG